MIQKQLYRNKVISLALAVVFVIFLSPLVFAAERPPLPTAFYGVASIDGEYLPAGTTITAKIEGVEKGSIQTQENGVFGGSRGDDGKLFVHGTDSNDVQKYISFFAGEQEFEQKAIYDSSTHEIILSIGVLPDPPEEEVVEEDTSEEEDTSLGNSGTTTDIDACVESWICTGWSECDKQTSIQTRICSDANNCGTTVTKPGEENDCVYIPTLEEQEQDMVEYDRLKAEEERLRKEQELENSKNELIDSQATSDSQDNKENQNNENNGSSEKKQAFPFDSVAGVAVILLLGAAGYVIFMKFKRGN